MLIIYKGDSLMAKIKISSTKVKVTRRTKKTTVKVSIPKKVSKISHDLRDYSVLLHGEKKIGKTTLWAQEKNAFFLMFDPIQKAQALLQKHVPSWPHFLAYIDLLEKDSGDVRTVIVDGADIAYQLCFNWSCQKMAIVHPHDENDYGKSWNFIRHEFEGAILRLLALNEKGIASRFNCHSKWAEIKTRGGGKTEKLVTYLTSQAEEVLNGRIDLWAAYTYIGKKRVLIIEGDEEIGAGHRIDGAFRTPDGESIAEIDMGRSPKQAYDNLFEAFANEQTYTTMDELTPKKSKKKKIKMKMKIRK